MASSQQLEPQDVVSSRPLLLCLLSTTQKSVTRADAPSGSPEHTSHNSPATFLNEADDPPWLPSHTYCLCHSQAQPSTPWASFLEQLLFLCLATRSLLIPFTQCLTWGPCLLVLLGKKKITSHGQMRHKCRSLTQGPNFWRGLIPWPWPLEWKARFPCWSLNSSSGLQAALPCPSWALVFAKVAGFGFFAYPQLSPWPSVPLSQWALILTTPSFLRAPTCSIDSWTAKSRLHPLLLLEVFYFCHLPKILCYFSHEHSKMNNNNNKNNLQGDRTLDINKDTIHVKESLCWLWLRRAGVSWCWGPRLSLCYSWRLRPEWCSSGLCTTGLDSWSPSTTPSLTVSQTECLQLQSDFKFLLLGVLSSHLSLGSESWVGMD